MADREARADLDKLRQELATVTNGWTARAVVRSYDPGDDGQEALLDDAMLFDEHGYDQFLEREGTVWIATFRKTLADRATTPRPPEPWPLTDHRAPPASGMSFATGPVNWVVPTPRPRSGTGFVQRILLELGLTPPAAGEARSRAALEAWLEGRMLAVVGGVALLLGAVFFLSLAFSRGWITEPLRVLIGLIAGAGLLVLGEFSFTRLRGIVGHVLVAVGLATISLALLAATRLYHLVPVEWGLLGAFVAAVAAAAIAVRHDSQVVAAFGLVAVLAAPPVLGASPTLVTLLFVAATLVGTTGVALFRTWVWLPPLAFVLAGPQLASYVAGGPPVAEGLIAIAGFWLVNLLAAGGEETRHATDRLRTTTVTLLLAAAAFTTWAGFAILSGPQEEWRGTFLAVMAVAHLALGLAFLARNGDRHPFGLVVAATGVAALTMAVPVQFGGPPVPIAWAAEAVALAWVAVLRRHPYSAGVSVLLGILALGHLALIEYRPSDLAAGFARSIPFVGPEGMTFGFMIAALAVTGLIIRIAWLRAGLVVVGGLVATYVFPFELSGTALVAGWAALAAAGLGVYARIVTPRIRGFKEDRVPALGLPGPIVAPVAEAVSWLSSVVRPAFVATAVIAGVGAVAHLAVFDYPALSIFAGTPHDIPFVGLPGLSFAIVLGAIAGVGLLVPLAWVRVGLAALGGLVALYVFPFELSGPALVAGWAALATAAFGVEARVVEPRVGPAFDGAAFARLMRPTVRAVGALIGVAVLAHLVVLDFPIYRLGRQILSNYPYVGQESLSLAAALATLVAVGAVMGARWIRLGMAGIGAALLVFTVTFEVGLPHVTVAWALLTLASVAIVRRVALVAPIPTERRPLIELAGERLPYAAAGLALLFLSVQALWFADPVSFGRYATGNLTLDGTPFLDRRTYVCAILAATAGPLWLGLARGHAGPPRRDRGRAGRRVAAAVRDPPRVRGSRLVCARARRALRAPARPDGPPPARLSVPRPRRVRCRDRAVNRRAPRPVRRRPDHHHPGLVAPDRCNRRARRHGDRGRGRRAHPSRRAAEPAGARRGGSDCRLPALGCRRRPVPAAGRRTAAGGTPEGSPGRSQRAVVGARRRRVRHGPCRTPTADPPVRPRAAGARDREGLPRRPRGA